MEGIAGKDSTPDPARYPRPSLPDSSDESPSSHQLSLWETKSALCTPGTSARSPFSPAITLVISTVAERSRHSAPVLACPPPPAPKNCHPERSRRSALPLLFLTPNSPPRLFLRKLLKEEKVLVAVVVVTGNVDIPATPTPYPLTWSSRFRNQASQRRTLRIPRRYSSDLSLFLPLLHTQTIRAVRRLLHRPSNRIQQSRNQQLTAASFSTTRRLRRG